jgi:hypothetical protein
LGLYGKFGTKGGRIVLTGLDNDFHGVSNGPSEQQNQRQNHYKLLFNEICWVMGDVLSGGEDLCQT